MLEIIGISLSLKKFILTLFLLILTFSTIFASIVGWAGLNKISKTVDSDRIELTNGVEIKNRIDFELNKYYKAYNIGIRYSLLQPASIREFMLKGMMREKGKYRIGVIMNASSVTSGLSLLGSKYFYVKDIPFKINGEVEIFKDYGSISSGFSYFYLKSGYLKIMSSAIDTKKENFEKMFGLGVYQLIDKKHAIKGEVRYSTKNGFEFLVEPRFRTGDIFYIALESYIATKNNSAFGISLIYSPLKKKKIVKKPVKPVIEEPEEEPVIEEPIIEDKPIIEKPIETEPEEVIKSPEELKRMLNQVVDGPYQKGVNLYCEDRFEDAIKEWKKALKLLEDKSFITYKEAQDYKSRCKRNIENAEKKLKIIREE